MANRLGGLGTLVNKLLPPRFRYRESSDVSTYSLEDPMDMDLLRRLREEGGYGKVTPRRIIEGIQQHFYDSKGLFDFDRARDNGQLELPTNQQALDFLGVGIKKIEAARNMTGLTFLYLERNVGWKSFNLLHDYLVAVGYSEKELPVPGYLAQKSVPT